MESHKRLQIPGPIIRLMSCDKEDYAVPRSSYAPYHVVRVPQFNPLNGDDFSPRNKGAGLKYWLLQSNSSLVPEPEDVIILADPDQIFISHLDLDEVRHGFGMASSYAMGPTFLRKYSKFCDGRCDRLSDADGWELSYGAPYILTTHDFRLLTPLWTELTEEFRRFQDKADWLTEMYSYVIASLRLNITHQRLPLMVSNAQDDGEPWRLLRWHTLSQPPASFLHYCQRYNLAGISWSKHDHHNLELKACDRRGGLFREPSTAEERQSAEAMRGRPLHKDWAKGQPTDRSSILEARQAWMFEKVVTFANEAFRGYYEEFC